MTREQILAALSAFIRQRPGLKFCNYGDIKSYRSEMRSITQDRHDAERLLAQVAWRQSIGVEELRESFRAFSGRLSLHETDTGCRLEYCTGQYFPTEYRKAVCAVLAQALWYYVRANIPNDAEPSPGDAIRKTFRREFGARMQQRWFD